MDLANLASVFVSLASDAVVAFVGLSLVDVLFGAVIAARQGKFDWNYLPNFLSTNLGTKYGLVVLAAILAASQTGGSVHAAALAVVTAGGGAMSASLVKDIVVKVQAFLAKPAAAEVAKK
jgi:hypothetical protein